MATTREMLPYGYVTYTGRVLSNATIDGYNDIQRDINAWINANRAVPEWLLDWSFRYLRDAIEC